MDFKESYSRLIDMKQVKSLPGISKSHSTYAVQHVNHTDFIIKINVKDSDIEELRFLFTKNEFTAKTKRGIKEIKYLKNVDIQNLFYSEVRYDVHNAVCDDITCDSLIFFRSQLHDKVFIDMLKDGWVTLKNIKQLRNKGLLKEGLNTADFVRLQKHSIFFIFYRDHVEIARWLVKNTSFATSSRFNDSFMYAFATLVETYGEDIAKYFAESYNKSSVEYHDFSTFFQYDKVAKEKLSVNGFKNILEKVGDIRRFIDYSLFEIYTQGFTVFNGTTYSFYLNFIEKHKKLNNGASCFSRFSQNYRSDTHFAKFWAQSMRYKDEKDKDIKKIGKYKFIEPCDDYYHATRDMGYINQDNLYTSTHIYNVYRNTENKFLGIVGKGFIYPESEEFRDELLRARTQLYSSFTQKEKADNWNYLFYTFRGEEVCPGAGKPVYSTHQSDDIQLDKNGYRFTLPT